MAIIGFSTGAIAFDDFTSALRLLALTRANAVELSALRAIELPILLSALPLRLNELRQRYEYISFHAPTNFDDERSLVPHLKRVADMGINIIVHPDTMHDISIWKNLGNRLCLENMDSRKAVGRTAEELRKFFNRLPDARLCFDIAHARQVDSSMAEAVRIIEEFGERLVQVHLSEVNSKGKHFSMSFAAKRAYEPFAEILSTVPVILESVVGNDEIVREISETERLLSFRRPRSFDAMQQRFDARGKLRQQLS
jgi:sugar phosphate isomerase/epimerase